MKEEAKQESEAEKKNGGAGFFEEIKNAAEAGVEKGFDGWHGGEVWGFLYNISTLLGNFDSFQYPSNKTTDLSSQKLFQTVWK